MNRYPLLSRMNVPAYLTVMSLWVGASVVLALLLATVTAGAVRWATALIFAPVAVMSGMLIMFGASALNLRKLRPGFQRLATGARDPAIPPVWCPVLTMATRAAVDLCQKVHDGCGAAATSG